MAMSNPEPHSNPQVLVVGPDGMAVLVGLDKDVC